MFCWPCELVGLNLASGFRMPLGNHMLNNGPGVGAASSIFQSNAAAASSSGTLATSVTMSTGAILSQVSVYHALDHPRTSFRMLRDSLSYSDRCCLLTCFHLFLICWWHSKHKDFWYHNNWTFIWSTTIGLQTFGLPAFGLLWLWPMTIGLQTFGLPTFGLTMTLAYDNWSTDIWSADIWPTMIFLAETEAGMMKRILYQWEQD